MKAAVFLDRDGVVNRVVLRDGRPHPPSCVEELELAPRAAEAVDLLHRAGFVVVVVSNQPDVAMGAQRREVVERINEEIRRRVRVDDIRVCYHADRDGCGCRKPRPGMLLEAAREWSVALARSFLVGDRWRDIAAGRAAGCTTILVGDGYGEPFPETPHAVVPSLFEASRWILSSRGEDAGASHAESA